MTLEELRRLQPGRSIVAGEPAAPHAAPGTAELFTTIPDAPGHVALTFDMGGRLDPALAIVSWLADNQVCATVFPTGDAALTTTGTAVLQALRRHPELFEVGNHTMNHGQLVLGW